MHFFHAFNRIGNQHKHFLFVSACFIGFCLQIIENIIEKVRFKIRRIRPIDKITAQRIIFQRHFFKPKFNSQFAATHRNKQIFYLLRQWSKPVNQFLSH